MVSIFVTCFFLHFRSPYKQNEKKKYFLLRFFKHFKYLNIKKSFISCGLNGDFCNHECVSLRASFLIHQLISPKTYTP